MDRDSVLAAAKRMLDRGVPMEKVKQFVDNARARVEANAKDTREASELSRPLKAATFVERGVNAAGFGLPSLAGDLVSAALRPSANSAEARRNFAEVREERKNRNSQLGAAGYAADLVGGLATGASALNALKAVPRLAAVAKAKPWLLAAGEAGTQAGVTGAAEGLDDLSLAGLANSAKLGGATAAGGAALGAVAGKVAGGVAKWWKGKNLAKELVARGVKLDEAQAIATQLPSLDNEGINAAMGRVDEMVKAGRGDQVMAADVLGGEGHNALRSAMNIAGDADQVARERIRSRDAGIVRRGREDLGEAAGFTPEQMDAHENSILAQRKARADESYGKARAEGARPAPEYARKLIQEATDDPRVQSEFSLLQAKNPNRFATANPGDFNTQLELYQRVNRRLRALDNVPNADPQDIRALLDAKNKLGIALELRSPTFRKANAEFSEFSQGLDAYETGQEVASQAYPSDARRIASAVDPSRGAELRKGFVDRMAEDIGRGPNEELGAAGRADSSIRHAVVGSENAAEKIRDHLGPSAYKKLLRNAKAEGRMAATSSAGLGNSSTAKQVSGLSGLLNVAEEAGASISANPVWMGTMFARRVATDKMSGLRKKAAMGAAKKISDALTRGGRQEARSVLEDLAAEFGRREMAQSAGRTTGRYARNAVARAAAPND